MSSFLRKMNDKINVVCPICGGTEMIEAAQSGYAAIYALSHWFGGRALYHTVCRNCGTVVRSYVKEPEKLLKRRDRRQS